MQVSVGYANIYANRPRQGKDRVWGKILNVDGGENEIQAEAGLHVKCCCFSPCEEGMLMGNVLASNALQGMPQAEIQCMHWTASLS